MKVLQLGLNVWPPVGGNLLPMHDLDHRNSFDMLRILAAAAVVFSHSLRLFAIGTDPTLTVFPRDDLSAFGVMVFFAVSGYLVSRSASRTKSIAKFARNRALRILPGLIACLLVTVLIVGAIATTLPITSYFSNWQTYRYWLNVLLFPLQTELPGVFLDNPRPGTVNGSLWTLSSEISAYVLVAIAFLYRDRARTILLGLAAFLILYYALAKITGAYPLLYHMVEYDAEGHYFFLLYFNKVDASRLIAVFMVGGLLNYAPPTIFRGRYVLLCVGLMALTAHTPIYEALVILVVPYATVTIGRKPFANSDFLRRYDLSYGIYLYHAPLMQLSWTLLHPHLPPLGQLTCGILLTISVAAASWLIVERPALKAKSGSSLLTSPSVPAAAPLSTQPQGGEG